MLIKLLCGIEVEAKPEDLGHGSVCRCGKEIHFARTMNGKKMPMVWRQGEAPLESGWDSHFIDCPLAGEFRKKGKTAAEIAVKEVENLKAESTGSAPETAR